MNSNYIKTALLCWIRFSKQIAIVATEVGNNSADVAYSVNNCLYEIEVKVSVQDFKEDFKKPKHIAYKMGKGLWTPNYFSFAVPDSLVDKVMPLVENTPYGLIAIVGQFDAANRLLPWDLRTKTIKRAKSLHTNRCAGSVKHAMVKRMASELCGHRQKSYSDDTQTTPRRLDVV